MRNVGLPEIAASTLVYTILEVDIRNPSPPMNCAGLIAKSVLSLYLQPSASDRLHVFDAASASVSL